MVQTHNRYKENNPIVNNNMAIIVTSYNGHFMFLKYALEKYMESEKYVIVAYDRQGEAIPCDLMDIPNSWVMKHRTWGSNKRIGWLFDIIYGAGIVSLYDNFEYIATVNGDTIWDKPNNINQIINLLGNNDIISSSSESNGMIHTCNVVWKRNCFFDFISYIKNKLSNNIPESYSPEVLLRDFIQQSKYKNKISPKQPLYPKGHFYEGKIDHYSSYHQDSTWKEILGYRNLGGEHKAACLEHLEVLPDKYIDLRNEGEFFSQHEKQTLYKYYMTNDRRWLYMYYDQGEDSYWNRRYYDIGYYGSKPLYDDLQRKKFGPTSERLGYFDRWKYNSYILKDEEYHNKWKKVIDGG